VECLEDEGADVTSVSITRGEQLSLFEGGLPALRIPWDGCSPRELTRAYNTFILKARAAKSTSAIIDPGQLELWPINEKAPWKYRGAPLLKGSPRRR